MRVRFVALILALAALAAVAGCGGEDPAADRAADEHAPRRAAASALRDAFTTVSTATVDLDACETRRCLRWVGRGLDAAAGDAAARLRGLDTGPLPACYANAIRQATRAMAAYRRAGRAMAAVDAAAAQEAISRASRFEAGVTRSIAACST